MITASEIRAIRAYLHETQAKFASRFGVNRYAVAFWEQWGIADNDRYETTLRALREAQNVDAMDGGTSGGSEAAGG